MTTHELKTWPEFFDAVERGDKAFEVRKNDRGFQRGDILRLWRWDPRKGRYVTRTGVVGSAVVGIPQQGSAAAYVDVEVIYVLNGFGIESGHVVMGIKRAAAK